MLAVHCAMQMQYIHKWNLTCKHFIKDGNPQYYLLKISHLIFLVYHLYRISMNNSQGRLSYFFARKAVMRESAMQIYLNFGIAVLVFTEKEVTFLYHNFTARKSPVSEVCVLFIAITFALDRRRD